MNIKDLLLLSSYKSNKFNINFITTLAFIKNETQKLKRMKNFIEIICKKDTVHLLNINHIVRIKVDVMALCTIIMIDKTEIETEIYKEDIIKQIKDCK